jgi:hypothetical protein
MKKLDPETMTPEQLKTYSLIRRNIFAVVFLLIGIGFYFVATKNFVSQEQTAGTTVNVYLEAYWDYIVLSYVLFGIAAILVAIDIKELIKKYKAKKAEPKKI